MMINFDTLKLLHKTDGVDWQITFHSYDDWQMKMLVRLIVTYGNERHYGHDDKEKHELKFLEHALYALYQHNIDNYSIALKNDGFRVIIHHPMTEDVFNVYQMISNVITSGEKLLHTGGYRWFNRHDIEPTGFTEKTPELYHFFEINFT
jgi:hypothetical protein